MRSRWFGLVVAALAVAASVWAFPRLPDTVATHWNLRGEPDGFSPRFWAVAFMPLLILGTTALFNVLPKLDPRRANYDRFIDSYWLIANAVIALLLVAHALVVGSGLGYEVQVDRLLPVGLGLFLAFLGNYLTRVEPNWFVGIRTPWTLSSDTVWRKTHRTGGWMLVVGGLVVTLGAFLPRERFFPLMIATIVIATAVPVVQSYVLWKREKRGPRPESS
jgi:immunity protein, SdpI family